MHMPLQMATPTLVWNYYFGSSVGSRTWFGSPPLSTHRTCEGVRHMLKLVWTYRVRLPAHANIYILRTRSILLFLYFLIMQGLAFNNSLLFSSRNSIAPCEIWNPNFAWSMLKQTQQHGVLNTLRHAHVCTHMKNPGASYVDPSELMT